MKAWALRRVVVSVAPPMAVVKAEVCVWGGGLARKKKRKEKAAGRGGDAISRAGAAIFFGVGEKGPVLRVASRLEA